MDYVKMTSACGLNCATCEIHTNYDGKDPRNVKLIIALAKPFLGLAALFSHKLKAKLRVLNRIMKIPSDRPLCLGCRAEHGKIPILGSNSKCPILQCTEQRGIHNCSECGNFPCSRLYPSSFLADTIPHNTKIVNCCLIRKHGLQLWSEEFSEKVKNDYFSGRPPLDF